MQATALAPSLDPHTLLDIIQTQSEIVKLGPDLGAVINLVADRARHLTQAGGAIVELAEGDDMVYRAAVGMAQAQLGLRLRRKGSLSGLCIEVGDILQCRDSETDDRVDRDACRRVGLRSMVVVPLVHQEDKVGVLKIASAQPDAFGEQDLCVLRLMSDLIAAAMHQAVKHETSDLYHRATHDSLTGLANRALFYDRLRQSLDLSCRRSMQSSILMLDMDGLKPINDHYGHRAGDAAICETATRIKRVIRQSDTAARLGGDEFGVILPDIPGRDSALSSAERIVHEVQQPFHFEEQSLNLGISVGVAVFPEDGAEMTSLIERADRFMYEVKRTRKTAR